MYDPNGLPTSPGSHVDISQKLNFGFAWQKISMNFFWNKAVENICEFLFNIESACMIYCQTFRTHRASFIFSTQPKVVRKFIDELLKFNISKTSNL